MDASGHRARLRRRLFEGGPDALLDHELVEYLLALALPRRDTKPLAKTLIEAFGGFGALLAADAEAIMRIGGVSEGAAAARGRPCSTISTPTWPTIPLSGCASSTSMRRTC